MSDSPAWKPNVSDVTRACDKYADGYAMSAALIAGAGPAIAALQLENAALGPLEKERDCYASACEHLNATIATLQQRVVECEAALKPFAQAADDLHDILVDGCEIWETPAAMGITAGDLRRAQAVLAFVQEQPK